MVVTIMVSQLSLVVWKKKYPRSFYFFTLAGLWLIPSAISVYSFFIRFLCIWAAFSAYTGEYFH
jgi:hypothetical protein